MSNSARLDPTADGVVLSFDAAYLWPACVTLQSLVETWDGPGSLRVYCLCDLSVDPGGVDALHAVAAQGRARLHIVRETIDLPHMRIPYISAMGYGRLLAPQMIDVERLVYLDADTLACAGVGTLLRPIAAGRPIAAVRDPYIPELATPHVEANRIPVDGRAPQAPYFNSGVLGIDVATWRREKVTERTLSLLGDPDWRPMFGDQDTLNHVLAGRFELLDPRWNVMPVSDIQKCLDFTYHGERYTPLSYQQELEEDPWILHFATEVKPWSERFPDGPLRRRWRSVAERAAELVVKAGLAVPEGGRSANSGPG